MCIFSSDPLLTNFDMLSTDATWFGVTYQEDRPVVEAALRRLHADGVYPEKL